MHSDRTVVDLDLPLRRFTPSQRVIWTIVASGLYGRTNVLIQPLEPRWGIIPPSDLGADYSQIIHICHPRKIYSAFKHRYAEVTEQFSIPAGHIKGPFEVQVTRPDDEKTGGLELVANEHVTMAWSDLKWHSLWDCHKLPARIKQCPACDTDVPAGVIAIHRLRRLTDDARVVFP